MTDSDSSSPSESARELFQSYRETTSPDSDASDFDAFCEDHQEFEEDLRQLYRDWQGLPDPESLASTAALVSEGKVIGDYHLIRRLGRGGMGEVWECEQRSLRRKVAVKFLRPEFTASERDLSRFQREAEAAGRLSHRAIVMILGKEEAEGIHFIVQELVPGDTNLHDRLNELRGREELPSDYLTWVTRFFLRIAEALQVAHDAGVTHRDLKPANILITEDGRPKITDFGLAQFSDQDSISHTGEMSGTYLYMSPEQAMAKRIGIDHRTDVFSLAATLYEALTLTRAFAGDTPHQVIEKILMEDPPEPRVVRSRIPLDLSLICMKGLEKQRAHRYQSMQEMADEFRRVLNQQPVLARRPGPWRRLSKWARRHPAAFVGVGTGLVALLIVSVLFAITWSTKRELQSTNQQLAIAHREEAAARQQADQEKANVLRLSDLRSLRELNAAAEELWPAHPRLEPAYLQWIAEAEELLSHVPEHETSLKRLTSEDSPSLSTEQRRWWTETLESLVAEFQAFADAESGTLASVKRRLETAKTLWARSVEDYEVDWDDALFQIYDSPHYQGLEMEAQIGLVPIGPDPSSGLWEFAHLESGDVPERDPLTETVEFTGETGVVLILVPGGTFWMGSQGHDRDAPGYDPDSYHTERPPTERTVEPFFLAKYEFTQGQWKRLTGANPSDYGRDHLDWALHPVDNVTWYECRQVLKQIGLALPTEEQWEYAARAGTTTPFWTGSAKESLREAVNIADRTFKGNFPNATLYETWLDDGAGIHERVGLRRPNPFGFVEILGNVREWTEDLFRPYVEGLGHERNNPFGMAMRAEPPHRAIRGADFQSMVSDARCANRYNRTPEGSGNSVGFRAMRPIDSAD